MWLTASPRNTVRAIHDEAVKLLDKTTRARIAERHERLVLEARERDARMEELALKDVALPRPTARFVAHQLGKLLEPDAIVLNDASGASRDVAHFAKRHLPGTYFRSGSSAGGFASGAAVGVKLARPDRDVIVPSGDGFYAYGVPEAALAAAAYHNAPYLSVVFNNGSYRTGTSVLKETYPDGVAVRTGNYEGGVFRTPDYARVAESVGGYGETVEETTAVGPALKRGLDATRQGAPAVIMVSVPGPVEAGKPAGAAREPKRR
jgi:acetolactate synthase-1/2/3 large subunit